MNVWYDKNSMTPFAFCTSGLQVFVGMSALQGETRCEALERLNIIVNVFWLLFYLNGSKWIRRRENISLPSLMNQRPGATLQGQVVTAWILDCWPWPNSIKLKAQPINSFAMFEKAVVGKICCICGFILFRSHDIKSRYFQCSHNGLMAHNSVI